MKSLRHLLFHAVLVLFGAHCASLFAQQATDLTLGAGDTIRIQVFQNADLSIEARVSETGFISYPLLGSIKLGGLSIAAAEKTIANGLQGGGFVKQPQVNIALLQVRGSQVSVLGQVGRPGQFPLETSGMRVTDILARAGGVGPAGDDVVILTGTREGKAFRKSIDVPSIFTSDVNADNVAVMAGDNLFVPRAPVFYIYGEVQKPGSYKIERGMTVRQALATGGGPTQRGSEKRMRLDRVDGAGVMKETAPSFNDSVQANDVIYVKESLF